MKGHDSAFFELEEINPAVDHHESRAPLGSNHVEP